jgi:hypothetical protein
MSGEVAVFFEGVVRVVMGLILGSLREGSRSRGESVF